MREKILEDLKAAMKAQDKETLIVIRMVKGAIQMEELNVKHELNDEEVIGIISHQIKTRKESIEEFKRGNRDDLIEKTASEIAILERYMPEQLSKEKVIEIIDQVFESVNPTEKKAMGEIMGKLNSLLKGRADMKEVSSIVKDRLSKI